MSPASLSLLLIRHSPSQVSLLSTRSKDSDTLSYAIIAGIKLLRVSIIDMVTQCLLCKVVTVLSTFSRSHTETRDLSRHQRTLQAEPAR
jgi:hypothetical protein